MRVAAAVVFIFALLAWLAYQATGSRFGGEATTPSDIPIVGEHLSELVFIEPANFRGFEHPHGGGTFTVSGTATQDSVVRFCDSAKVSMSKDGTEIADRGEPSHAREWRWPVGFEININSRHPVMRVVINLRAALCVSLSRCLPWVHARGKCLTRLNRSSSLVMVQLQSDQTESWFGGFANHSWPKRIPTPVVRCNRLHSFKMELGVTAVRTPDQTKSEYLVTSLHRDQSSALKP
jgi:hypothetical protein